MVGRVLDTHRREIDPTFDLGLPAGTAARAMDLAESAAAAASAVLDRTVRVDAGAVMRHLHLPWLVGRLVETRSPIVMVRGGAVHVDLADGDLELFAELRRAMVDADAEELASAAQEWRLPVTPYRSARRPSTLEPSPTGSSDGSVGPTRSTARVARSVRVVDLTSMWAGPLCTWLLASMECEVVTIEAPCRPDGLRGSPGHFETLAAGKRRLPLDLRRSEDRRVFERLVRTADLVVESYSSRVMPNLGYGPEELRALNPAVTTLSIRAFDRAGDERSWVSYGPGVHAASGHGTAGGVPRPATHAYADALTGLAAAAEAWHVLGAEQGPPAVVIGMDRVVDGLGPTPPPPTPAQVRHLVDRVATGRPVPLLVEGARRD